MKLLFVNTPTREHPLARDMAGGLGFDRDESVVLPPLDLAYLAAASRRAGHSAEILDPDTEGWTAEETLSRCREKKWDVAVCTVSLPSMGGDCGFVRKLRLGTNRTLLVHTNITQAPILQDLLENSGADFGLYGECELLMDDILNGRICQGTFRVSAGTLVEHGRGVVDEVDHLPHPARDLLPNSKYRYSLLGSDHVVTTVQTSRGCPFPCGYYCPYPLVQGKTWRARSPEHVLEELIEVRKVHGISNVLFRDAVFTLDKDRCREICARIVREDLPLRWWCETRADFLDEPLLKAMRDSGCQGINVGVETGDPEVLRTEAKKGLTHERLAQVVQMAHRLGLRIHFLLMVGLPGETRMSLYKTHTLVRDLDPDSIGVTIVTPYPGTPLFAEASAKGWIESTEWQDFGGHAAVIHTDHLTAADLVHGRRTIEKLYALQKSPHWLKRNRFRRLSARFERWARAAPVPAADSRKRPRPEGASPGAGRPGSLPESADRPAARE